MADDQAGSTFMASGRNNANANSLRGTTGNWPLVSVVVAGTLAVTMTMAMPWPWPSQKLTKRERGAPPVMDVLCFSLILGLWENPNILKI